MTQTDNAQLAVLIERLDSVIAQQNELKGMVSAQSAQLGAIPVMQAQLTEFNDKFGRAFDGIRDARKIADDTTAVVGTHSTLIRIAGTLILACLGLVGWGWKQIEGFKGEDAALDRRTLLIEYKLGVLPPNAEGGK